MAFWPFRKKRKNTRDDKEAQDDDLDLGVTTHISGPIGTKNRRNRSRQESQSKQPTRPTSKNRSRTGPASAAAAEVDPAAKRAPPATEEKSSKDNRQPLGELQHDAVSPPQPPFKDEKHLSSQTSLQPENFTVRQPPTLTVRKSQTVPGTPRARSSKRKVEEKNREQEIRAMSTPIPIPKRPRSFTFNSPLAQDSRQVRNGLNRHFERPHSEVSLPIPESLRSSISGVADMSSSYRISTFASLSPRPTIRHTDSLGRFSEVMSRESTKKSKNPVIPEEDFSPRARVEELVDDMDAATLRKVMERDRRRRQKKKKMDTEQLERRLQRKLDKQKASDSQEALDKDGREEAAKVPEPDPAQEPEPGTTPASPQEESSQQARKRRPPPLPPQSPSSWLQDDTSESVKADDEPMATPLDIGSDGDEPVLQTARTVRLSSASMSPPASPAIQQSPKPEKLSLITIHPTHSKSPSTELTESERTQASDADRSGRSGNSGHLKSIFKRNATKKEPEKLEKPVISEFTNTSRESFIKQQQRAPPPLVIERSFKPKGVSGSMQRTRSKFREDLPDFRRTPPESPREPVSPMSPYIDDASKVESMTEEDLVVTPLEDVHPVFRSNVAERAL